MTAKHSIKHRISESHNNLVETGRALADLLKAPQICADIRVFAKIKEAHQSVVDARQIMLGIVGGINADTE